MTSITGIHHTSISRNSAPSMVQIDREWARLRRRSSTLRRLRAWPALAEHTHHRLVLERTIHLLDDLDDMVRATDERPRRRRRLGAELDSQLHHPDEILAALVSIARTDDIAARVMLRRVSPGLISQAKRWKERASDTAAIDNAIGAAWLAIATYDPVRRPRHIAGALVADSMWIAFRRHSRLASTKREIPMPNGVLALYAAPPRELDPMVALAGTVRLATKSGVPADQIELVCELARDTSTGELADRERVTARTIRNRRDVALFSVRSSLGPDRGDWRHELTAAA